MNPTHLHLVITHLPIYGAVLGSVALAFGMITRSRNACNAAYVVLLISAIGGIIAYVTGEPAEETVENVAGISKDLIEDHEDSAKLTLILIITMGLSSIAGLYFTLKSSKFIKGLSILVLIISIACFVAAARTGYMGGSIRHTEISAP